VRIRRDFKAIKSCWQVLLLLRQGGQQLHTLSGFVLKYGDNGRPAVSLLGYVQWTLFIVNVLQFKI
jgi:hypothetical protein